MSKNGQINVLVADDETSILALIEEELDKKRFRIKTAQDGERAWMMLTKEQFDVAVLDLRMPKLDGMEVFRRVMGGEFPPEFIILTGHGNIQTAVEAMRMGAFDFMTKPVGIDKLELSIIRAYEKREMRRENLSLRYELDQVADSQYDIITADPEMKAQLKLCEKIAAHDTTVLVEGESGTGKELIARRIHNYSPRAENSFIAFNCAALPETLIESELFGYYKGAFTGAEKGKPGLFELANFGTLFFDEIGELSPNAQSKLLRVLETGSFYRLGGTSEVSVNVRIIAATNRDLKQMCDEGHFREDLYYRLNVMTISLPPLRDRKGDINQLARHFLKRDGFEHKYFSELSRTTMQNYNWPGNVRELEHAVMRAAILSETDEIPPSALPTQVSGEKPGRPAVAASLQPSDLQPLPLEALEKEHILRTLDYFEGHQGKAADALGISARTLYRKLKEYEQNK